MIIPRRKVNFSPSVYKALIKQALKGKVIEGPEVEAFEESFAQFIGTRYALALSSGRAAFAMALRALNLEEGDEVIISAFNFPLMPMLVKAMNLKPVFVDVCPDTYNINPSLIKEKLTSKSRALIVTHLFGMPADMEPIKEICQKEGLFLIEDCAHALGSEYKGKKVGTFGHMAIFTFAEGKQMPCFGGGMIVTSEPHLFKRLKEQLRGRPHSPWKKVATITLYYLLTHSYLYPISLYPVQRLLSLVNSDLLEPNPKKEALDALKSLSYYPRLITNLQAGVGLSQLKRIEGVSAKIVERAQKLTGLLDGLSVPNCPQGVKHLYTYYALEVKDVEEVRKSLLNQGIDTKRADMRCCPPLEPFNEKAEDYPIASSLFDKIIHLPCYPSLSDRSLALMTDKIKRVLSQG